MAFQRSPFPGMDPYLETHWLDVHGALIAETRRRLNGTLPDGLVARMEERIAIESSDEREYRVRPDVFVYEPSGGLRDKSNGGAVLIDAPYEIVVDMAPEIERVVRIESDDGQLITVIEFISPANKSRPGLDPYLAKREALLQAGVYLVEIDLVRAGSWQGLLQPHVCPPTARSLYRATIRPPGFPRKAHLVPIYLNAPLPEIQIPLRPSDPKLMLPLQPMIEAIYTDGRYGRTLDYTRPLDPPLPADDQAYSADRIKAGG